MIIQAVIGKVDVSGIGPRCEYEGTIWLINDLHVTLHQVHFPILVSLWTHPTNKQDGTQSRLPKLLDLRDSTVRSLTEITQ